MTEKLTNQSNYSTPQIKEKVLHTQIASYLYMMLADNVIWTTFENSNQQGGPEGLYKQKALKLKGLLKGFPDIGIFWGDKNERQDNASFKALFLEVKRPKGYKISPEQIDVQDRLSKNGAGVAVVHSLEDVHKQLILHKVPLRVNASII